MQRMRNGWAIAVAATLAASAPQMARAAAEPLPAGVTVQKGADGLVLASHGKPLYRIDVDRMVKRRPGANAIGEARWRQFGASLWARVPAPQDFKPSRDWSATPRAGGESQLTYKGDPLYVFTGDSLADAAKAPLAPQYFSSYAAKPTAIADGVPVATLYYHPALYQPPTPKIVAPSGVAARWWKTAFVFTDAEGRDLYIAKSAAGCAHDCKGLKRFAAPLAALPLGDWRPVQAADGERYWNYRGQAVYRAEDADADAPAGAWTRLELR